MQAVQILRNKAKETGNLKSTKEVTVKEEPAPAGSPAPQTIIIESPDPEVVYVPTYNPTVVCTARGHIRTTRPTATTRRLSRGAAFWSFTAGVIVGGAIWGNCNWGGNDVNIDINRQNNFNRNEINNNRNSNNTRQHATTAATLGSNRAATTSRAGTHNSEHRKGVGYKDSATQQKFGKGGNQQAYAGARAVSRPCANRAASRCRAKASGNQRDMAGNSVGSRDMGGASTRDLGGGTIATWVATAPAHVTWAAAVSDSTCAARQPRSRRLDVHESRVRDPPPAPLAALAAAAARSARSPAVAAACRAAVACPRRRRTAAMNRRTNIMRTDNTGLDREPRGAVRPAHCRSRRISRLPEAAVRR